MASIFDKLFPKQAAKLITNYGRTVTLKKVSEGAYDAGTGQITQTVASATTKCVITPVKMSLADGTNIMVGDLIGTFYHQGASAVPEIGDIVNLNPGDYRVISVTSVYSGEEITMYEALLRK